MPLEIDSRKAPSGGEGEIGAGGGRRGRAHNNGVEEAANRHGSVSAAGGFGPGWEPGRREGGRIRAGRSAGSGNGCCPDRVQPIRIIKVSGKVELGAREILVMNRGASPIPNFTF